MTAIYIDTASLPSDGNGHPMLSRLRMPHRRSFGDDAWTPTGTPEWRTFSADQPSWTTSVAATATTGFSLATDLGDGYGAVVIAGGAPQRADALAAACSSQRHSTS